MDKLLQQFVNDGLKQAVILQIKRYGQTIFEGTYGQNTKEYGVKIDTIFPVFSITKPIISTLILKLQEEGRLDVTDPVYWYLPEFYGGGKENICIWHFMCHTSGYVDNEIEDYIRTTLKEKYDITIPEHNMTDKDWDKYQKQLASKFNIPEKEAHQHVWNKLFLEMPVKRAPHTKMYYFSLGYEWLKKIVIKVGGKDIDQIAKEKLFDQLGMVDSHWITPKEKWDRIIGRVDECEGMPYMNSEELYLSESGSGGLKTTISDLMRFCEMIRNNGTYNNVRILSRASVKLMKTNQNDNLSNWEAWTLAFNFYKNKFDDCGALRTFGSLDHGGFASARILIDDAESLSVVMFLTSMTGKYHKIEAFAFNMLYTALL